MAKGIDNAGAKNLATIPNIIFAAAALILLIERYFATRKAYKKGRQDERETWIEQEKLWQKRVAELKKSNKSLWEKFKEIKRLHKEFEEYYMRTN